VLNDSESAIANFTVPTDSLLSNDTLQLQLVVTDADGLSSTSDVTIDIPPFLLARSFGFEELTFDNDGRRLARGFELKFEVGGTGQFTKEEGEFNFTWFESAGIVAMDFTAVGGLVWESATTYTDTNADGVIEDVLLTPIYDTVTLQKSALGERNLDAVYTGNINRFSITNNVAVADEPTSLGRTVSVYNEASSIPFSLNEGETRALQTNISTASLGASITDRPVPKLDALTFADDGSGFAAEKDQVFSWALGGDGHLTVTFTDGEVAEYYHLVTSDLGEIVATHYTYADTSVRVSADLSYIDNPSAFWDPSNLSGVYQIVTNTFIVADETEQSSTVDYRLAADGTGTRQSSYPQFDGSAFFQSLGGICWSVNSGVLVVDHVINQPTVIVGSQQPTPAVCGALTDDQVARREALTLYDEQGSTVQTVVRVSVNECGFDLLPSCALPVTDYYALQLERVEEFVGLPPIAAEAVLDSPAAGDVLLFDPIAVGLDLDGVIDPASVVIVRAPDSGTVAVDPTSGLISYISDAGTNFDEFQYVMQDDSGNISNVARAFVTIGAPVTVTVPSNINPAQGEAVILDGTGSSDDVAITSYQWNFLAGPVDVSISNANTDTASFTAPTQLGNYVFRLTVTDADGLSSFQDSSITVLGTPPNADVVFGATDQGLGTSSPLQGDVVVLDGTGSSDNIGIVSYSWTQTAGTTVVGLTDTSLSFVTFNVGDFIESVTFRLDVTDTDGLLDSSNVTLNVTGVPPVAIAADVQTLQFPETFVLDGSGSTDNIDNVTSLSYEWVQVGGSQTAADLTDTNLATVTYHPPTYSLLTGETLTFELTVTDTDGLANTTTVFVDVLPALPLVFYAIEEAVIPFLHGIDIGASVRYEFLDPVGSETIFAGILAATSDLTTVAEAAWYEESGSLIVDFEEAGGLMFSPTLSYEDIGEELDNVLETVSTFETINSAEFTLDVDLFNKDQVRITEYGTRDIFDETHDFFERSETFAHEDREFILYDADPMTHAPFVVTVGETRSLPVNQGAALSMTGPDTERPRVDALTFDSSASGTWSGGSFVWSVEPDGHLRVLFDNNDLANYYHLETKNSGDVIATDYVTESSTVHMASVSFTDDPTEFWGVDNTDIGGIYIEHGSQLLDDGVTRVPFETNLHIHPDGSGVLQEQEIDLFTGATIGWKSSYGICATVLDNGDLEINHLPPPLEGPTTQTNAMTCSYSDVWGTSYQIVQTLFDRNPVGHLRTLVRRSNNDCGLYPTYFPQPESCNSVSLNMQEIYPAVVEKIPFVGAPPIALPEGFIQGDSGSFASVGDMASSIDVMANEISASLNRTDPASIEIVVQPLYGTLTVNSDGTVTYTVVDTEAPFFSGESDFGYYRVIDAAGNVSPVTYIEFIYDMGFS
jgi:hypothetical protein